MLQGQNEPRQGRDPLANFAEQDCKDTHDIHFCTCAADILFVRTATHRSRT